VRIVDSDTGLSAVLRIALVADAYSVATAASGRDALRRQGVQG
jgi:DNA-binding response OmpR family regulator